MPPPDFLVAQPFFATRAAAAAAFVPRDNSPFVTKFDPTRVIEVFQPTRTVVVSQSIAPTELVPVGTTVDLVVTSKDQLPLGGFRELDPAVIERFGNKNVGDVIATLQGTDAKKVLERSDTTSYETLPANDKVVMNNFMQEKFGVDANANPDKAKAVFGNLRFLHDV